MSRLRHILLLALAFVALDLAAASPAAAQLRIPRDRGVQPPVHRSDSRGRNDRNDRNDRRRHADDDSDSDSDSDDSDRRRRGRDDRGRRDRRDTCVDLNRDGRCDYTSTRRYPDGRYPGRTDCVDRNRDGRCDNRGVVLRRLPYSQLLGALVGGR